MSLDQQPEFVKSLPVTQDAFLGGRIVLHQPKSGFRAGMDSVMLAAAVNDDAKRVLDLGAGVGTAALCALARLEGAKATLAERDADICELAEANIAHNQFEGRARLVRCDILASGTELAASGLAFDHSDSVIANPPFFSNGSGTRAADRYRAEARAMPSEDVDAWVRRATGLASPDGEVIFIYGAEGLAQIVEAFARRLGAITILPIVARAGQPAGRVLLRGIKGSRAPLTLMSPIVLHADDGNRVDHAVEPIFRDGAPIVW